jgi:putative transposase
MGKQAPAAAKTESVWRDRLTRHATSGLSVEAFCRNEGVSAWSLYRWRKLLGAGEQSAGAIKAKTPAPFVDLGAIPASQIRDAFDVGHAHGSAAGIELRIDLGGGLVLTIARS